MDDITNNATTGSYGSSVTPPAGANPNVGTNVQPQPNAAPPQQPAQAAPQQQQAQPAAPQQPATPPAAQGQQPQDPWSQFSDKPAPAADPWAAFSDKPAAPPTMGQKLNQLPGFWNNQKDVVNKSFEDMKAGFHALFPEEEVGHVDSPEDIANKLLGALQVVGSGIRYTTSPIEAAAKTVEDPFDVATGLDPEHKGFVSENLTSILSPLGAENQAVKAGAKVSKIEELENAAKKMKPDELPTNVSEINPNASLKNYENVAPKQEAPVDAAADKAAVADLQQTQAQIDQLTKLNDQTAAGKQQLGNLQAKADQLRTQLFGSVKPVEEAATTQEATTPVDKIFNEEKPTDGTAAGMKQRASAKYDNIDNNVVLFKPEETNAIFDAMKGEEPTNPVDKISFESGKLNQFLQKYAPARDNPLTMGNATKLDRELGDMISKEYGKNGLSDEGRQLLEAQQTLREAVAPTEQGQQLAAANKDWQQAAKLRDIEHIEARAEGSPNKATALRTYLNTYMNNPRNMRGWSDDEIAALKAGTKTGALEGTLKILGSKLNVPIAAAAEAFTGGLTGGAAAWGATHVATEAAKAGAAGIKSRQVSNLKKVLSGASKTTPKAKGPGILSRAKNAAGDAMDAAPNEAIDAGSAAIQKAPLVAPGLLNDYKDEQQ